LPLLWNEIQAQRRRSGFTSLSRYTALLDSTASSSDTLVLLNAGKLEGAKHIKISAGLTSFPQALYSLTDSLEILDLTGNDLTDLPNDLTRFKQLRILFCSSNQFTHVPEVLGQCAKLSMIGFKANQIEHIPASAIPTQHLRWFIVTDNRLKHLPDSLGECAKLQKLMLAGNQLSVLPESMRQCHALELLRLSANRFEALPDWLFNFPKLTWLAYAGNPCSDIAERTHMAQRPIRAIDWASLQLGHALGQGASGVSYQSQWQDTAQSTQPVAVKLFKGGVTSDGLPRCEMHANMLAGEHPNLVGLKGVVDQHPQGTSGLVMPLLEPDLHILADPPSFDSCTRDVYPQGDQLTLAQALHILQGVADALCHLHQCGLMHGDVYAHNILWSAQRVVLSDLGGASFLPIDQPVLAHQLRQLDIRAFDILIEELAERAGVTAQHLKQQLDLGGLSP